MRMDVEESAHGSVEMWWHGSPPRILGHMAAREPTPQRDEDEGVGPWV
jgi:hypothetical protein